MIKYIKPLYLILTFFLLLGCVEEEIILTGKSSINTIAVTDVEFTTATVLGNITLRAWPVQEYGFAIGESPEPENKVRLGVSPPNQFIHNFTNLKPGTIYYVRSYIKDTTGILYAESKMFETKIVPVVTSMTPNRVVVNSFPARGPEITVQGENLDGDVRIFFTRIDGFMSYSSSGSFTHTQKSGFKFNPPVFSSEQVGINKVSMSINGIQVKFADGVSNQIEVVKE